MKNTKHYISYFIVALLIALSGTAGHSQNIAINKTGNVAEASAILDCDASDLGLLVPRVELIQTTSASPITSPANSLLVYNTASANDVTPGYYYWNGSQWVKFGLANHVHANLTFNNSGSGAASGSAYNGSSATTISYNTIGAVGGSGTATRVAFWNGTSTLSSHADLYWDNSNARLGIGTTAPGSKLEIVGETRATVFRTSAGSAGTQAGGYIFSGPGDTDGGMCSTADGTLQFFTNSSEKVRFTASGQVGIGTTAPNALLTVGSALSGSALSPTFVTNSGSLGTTSGNSLMLASLGFTSTNNTSLGIKALRTANGTDWQTSAIGLLYNVDATSPINNAQIWMTWAGNVGIGTTAPAGKLAVIGDITSTTPTILTSVPGGALNQKSGVSFSSTFGSGTDYGPRRTADIVAGFNGSTWGTEYLAFNVGNNGSANDSKALTIEKMRIACNGNVGIGTTAPATALHISPASGLTLGLNAASGTANTAGKLNMVSAGDNAYSTIIQTGTQAANVTYTLPTSAGSINYVLQTNGSGVLSWASPTTIANAWNLTGNAGTSYSNFIGTTDSNPLYFRVNSLPAGHVSETGCSLGLGACEGNDCVAFGSHALYYSNNGNSHNTAVGNYVLFNDNLGTNNVGMGYQAGYGVSGIKFDYCTFLGANSYPTFDRTNVTMLGSTIANGQCTGNNQVLVGNTGVTAIRAQVTSITAYSDKRFKSNIQDDVVGLPFIMKLKPVSYNENPEILHHIWGTPDSLLKNIDHSEIKKIRFTGLLAQDVEQAMKGSGYTSFTGIDIPNNDKEVYSLRYGDFTMPMIKAIQEQQQIIEKQSQQIEEQKVLLELLMKKVEALEKK